MSEHYGPATVTPLTEVKREVPGGVEIKVESRVNGYSQASIVPAGVANLRAAPQPTATAVNMTIAHQQREDAQQQPQQHQPYWLSNREQQCCLVENGRRCVKPAGNASYSKRIQKTVAQRKLKLHMDNSARHIYICDYHKNVIQSLRTKRKRKDSEEDSGETDSGDHPEVDLYQLQVNTLRRYKKHFKVPSRPGMNKAQLADNLMKHFKTIPVTEKETLTFFIYMIKTQRSKFDREKREDD